MSTTPSKNAQKPLVIVVPVEALSSLPDGTKIADPGCGAWFSRIGGVDYFSTIKKSAVKEGPTWNPAEPIPISLDRVVEIARKAISSIDPKISKWRLTEITLKRLDESSPEKWFFVVGFGRLSGRQTDTADTIAQVAVDFLGRQGTITKTKNHDA
jgi:hypothetical protein